MRLIRLLIALACLVAGAVVGALNRDLVSIDLAFVQVGTTLGVALISALLLGVLLGGLAITASVVLPMRSRLSRLHKRPPASQTTTAPEQSDGMP
ncbi:lipopolysaccharide assembly protein LapA domain-containing protein [Marilutibacter chinensis]|uniref:Lipopolysaccharide assembly protein LapA domain-containing protein n=1 Tax=Marilutibacter chinensis TaxID=2912247 RepID=A0ABS9HND2_9GAMM|nr:lipopolysaccharide assembly protein LapA domain-containing protein [Lysobacter chinensis]MCF7220514.1 lipopolysaccharide assembly protein LapA domain-containing protein [Lysobacter chinensis]